MPVVIGVGSEPPRHAADDDVSEAISDDELTALALADTGGDLSDATPWSLDQLSIPVLPNWYMPPALATRCRGWKAGLVVAIIAAFLIVDAFGLCSTYG